MIGISRAITATPGLAVHQAAVRQAAAGLTVRHQAAAAPQALLAAAAAHSKTALAAAEAAVPEEAGVPSVRAVLAAAAENSNKHSIIITLMQNSVRGLSLTLFSIGLTSRMNNTYNEFTVRAMLF